MFSPELSQHWTSDQAVATNAPRAEIGDDEALSQAQQEALNALADRVNAARTIL